MLELQGLRSELGLLRIAFNDAIMHGNSIDEIRKVYSQIIDIQHNIKESKIELGKTEASANGVTLQNHL